MQDPVTPEAPKGIAQRWSLRRRMALFFAALGGGAIVVLLAAAAIAQSRFGGPVEGYVALCLMAGFGISGLCLWIGHLFDEHIARPLLDLAGDLERRAHVDLNGEIDTKAARYLGPLAPAAAALDQSRRLPTRAARTAQPATEKPPRPPSAVPHNSLRDLDFVVFDTETTGLDAKRDRLVQLAGLRLQRGGSTEQPPFDTLVQPGRRVPVRATLIHGISNEMLIGAPGYAQSCRAFDRYCEGAVLVAHNAPFDMGFLSRRLARSTEGEPLFQRPVLCTARLSRFLMPHTSAHTLDDLMARYEVRLDDRLRHSALGDAQATAEVFRKMLPVLKSRGIETLDQALEACKPVRRRTAETGRDGNAVGRAHPAQAHH